MIGVIARLMDGDTRLAIPFERAKKFWHGFHMVHRNDDEEELAQILTGAQGMYENEVWDMDRYLGKTTMPWTAMASLWDEQQGWGDNRDYATRLIRAFNHPKCGCSSEVKSCAEDAMATYKPHD